MALYKEEIYTKDFGVINSLKFLVITLSGLMTVLMYNQIFF